MKSLVGRTVGGKYEVREILGQGGMATVYLGFQTDVDRQVAIKVLPPHPGLDAQFIERFQLEARTVAQLQHPHILALYDFGTTDDDILYLVTPFIDGGSLGDIMVDGPMEHRMIERILREVAGAMDYAHRRGVIHRDIKPDNILMDTEGHVLLADFGIAKIARSDADLTGTGVVGTPAYMSPEQASGLELDSRSDIYSLGVVVFEMMTGRKPYVSETPMQVLVKHISDPVPSILDVNDNLPEDLEFVMKKVLAKQPVSRYQSASEFAEAFSEAIHNTGTLAAVRRETPLDNSRTAVMNPTNTGGRSQPQATPQPTNPQTVVVQQNTNTLVLLGGFALIAVVLLVAIFVLAGDRGETDETVAQATTAPTTDTTEATTAPTEPVPTAVAQVPEVETFGQASFSTIDNLGDSLNLRVENMEPPETGKVYVAWMINTRDDTKVNMGRVAVDAVGNGALAYSDPDGDLLPALYNAIAISLEDAADEQSDDPNGPVLYSASVPIELTDALSEIFVMSPDGHRERGLLASAQAEASFATQHAGLAAGSSSLGSMLNHVEHTLNILQGLEEDFDGNGRGSNPGTGTGLYTFLDGIETRLEAVTQSEDATLMLQTEAENIRICLRNVRIWADELVEIETGFLSAEDIESIADELAEATALAEQLNSGIDQNENGRIEPFEFECGLDQITTFGFLVANMELVEGALEAQ